MWVPNAGRKCQPVAWWAPHHHDGDDEAVRMKRKEGLISSITTFHNETRRAFTVPRRGRSWLEVLLWIHTHPLTISLAHTHAHTNTHGRFKVQEHLNTHVMGHNAIAYKTEGHFSFNRIRPNRSWWECGRREVISECGEWRAGGGVCGSIERVCVCACEWAQRCDDYFTLRLYAVEKFATMDMIEFLLKIPS